MNKVYKTIQERGDFVTDYVANGSFKSIKDHVQYNYSEDFAVLVRLVDYSNNFRGPFVYVDKNSYNFLSKSALIPGDLIISNVGENVGTVFQAPKLSKPMTLGPNSILVRMADGNKDFWYYWFNSSEGQQKLKSIVSSSAQPKFNKTAFKTLRIPIINNIVQKKIVTILKNLDLKIELNNQINSELEAMAKLIYDYWFVQFDFPDKKGKPYKSSGGKMVFSEELKREIPEGWEVNQLKNLLPVLTGKEDANFANENGKYNFFTCGEEILKCDTSAFQGKAILVAGNGNFNIKIFEGKFNAYQRTYVLIPNNPEHYTVVYMAVQNQLEQLTKGSRGSIVKFITKGDLENIQIVLPSDKNRDIFSVLNLFTKKIELSLQENQKLAELRDWLLPMLMNGQVKVED